MSALVFECTEPHARPARRSLDIDVGDEVALYVLPESARGRAGLRRTVLRHPDQNPPAGSTMVLWARVEGSSFTIIDVGPRVGLELVRGEIRSQVVTGSKVPGRGLFEAELSDQSRMSFELEVRSPVARGGQVGVAVGSTRKSRVTYAADNVWWLITDTNGIVVTVGIKTWDWIQDKALKAGIDSRVFAFAAGLVLSGVVVGWVAWNQYRNASTQEERAVEAEDALELAIAARQASLATELDCLAERQVLVKELGDLRAARRMAAEKAASFTLGATAAVEIGGKRLTHPDLIATDELARGGVITAILERAGTANGDPTPCLSHTAALSSDLPSYLLLWHPDPALQCPEDYDAVLDGVPVRGRWGLSDRSARTLGDAGHLGIGSDAAGLAEVTDDPRMEDRWSAFTVAQGVREVSRAILTAPTDGRPPVLPGEAQLWSLALLDAYNRMPSPADGARDEPVSSCVKNLITQLARATPVAGPGVPVLPSIGAVAAEEATVVASPTPGCPWPRDVVATSADAALQAVAREATLSLEQLEDN